MRGYCVRFKETSWFDVWVDAEDAEQARFKAECGEGSPPEYDNYTEHEVINVMEEEEAHA